jgi:hypothetical protein
MPRDLGLMVSIDSEAPMPQTPMPMPNKAARTMKKVAGSVTKAVETLKIE